MFAGGFIGAFIFVVMNISADVTVFKPVVVLLLLLWRTVLTYPVIINVIATTTATVTFVTSFVRKDIWRISLINISHGFSCGDSSCRIFSTEIFEPILLFNIAPLIRCSNTIFAHRQHLSSLIFIVFSSIMNTKSYVFF